MTDYAPSPAFTEQAIGKAELYDEAAADHEAFWAARAREYVTWSTDFDTTLDWSDAPFATWFGGGQLNAAYNCVDRHVEAGNGDRVAIHAVAANGDDRSITYSARSARRPTPSRHSAWPRATAWPSTCR